LLPKTPKPHKILLLVGITSRMLLYLNKILVST